MVWHEPQDTPFWYSAAIVRAGIVHGSKKSVPPFPKLDWFGQHISHDIASTIEDIHRMPGTQASALIGQEEGSVTFLLGARRCGKTVCMSV